MRLPITVGTPRRITTTDTLPPTTAADMPAIMVPGTGASLFIRIRVWLSRLVTASVSPDNRGRSGSMRDREAGRES